MVEILKSFEQIAPRLSPIVLVIPGLMATGLGLFVWLGGLGFRRVLMALVGSLAGITAAFCLADQRLGLVIFTGLVGGFMGVFFQRFFTAMLAGVLGAVVAFLIVAWPYLRQDQGTSLAAQSVDENQEVMTQTQSLEVIRICTTDLSDTVKLAARQLAGSRWALIGAVGLASLAGGLLLRHLGGALSCSIVGTALIFLGLVLLLFHKGASPVSRITGRPGYYALVFLSMVAFGTTEQWLLCRHAERRGKRRSKGKGAQPGQDQPRGFWRGR